MNPQQIANSNSSLYRWLESHKATSPFQYSLRKNVPPYSRLEQSEIGQRNVLQSQEIRFDVPHFGVLRGIRLRVQVRCTDPLKALKIRQWGPAHIFQRIELRSRDKNLATLFSMSLIDWYNQLDPNAQLFMASDGVFHAKDAGKQFPLVPGAGATDLTKVFEIPLPFSFTEKLKQHIDTRVTEPLQVVVRMSDFITTNAVEQVVGAGPVPYNIDNVQARYDYYVPGAAEQKMLNQEMLRDKSGLGVAKLQHSWYQEPVLRFKVGGTLETVDATLRMQCPFPVVKTIVAVRLLDPATGRDTSEYFQVDSFLRLINLVVQDAGATILQLSGDQVQLMNNMPGLGYTNSDKVYAIMWSMSRDVTEQTGFLSLKNHANPTIDLSVQSPKIVVADREAEVQVYHQYMQAVSVSPNDGTVINRTLS